MLICTLRLEKFWHYLHKKYKKGVKKLTILSFFYKILLKLIYKLMLLGHLFTFFNVILLFFFFSLWVLGDEEVFVGLGI